MASRPPRGRSRALACLLLCATLLLGPLGSAAAVVQPDDLVGDSAVSGLPAELVAKAPDIGAAAGVLMTEDGRILWARDADRERAMGSTTKNMTAIVALENASLD